MSFENRRWIFLNSGDIDKVNFNELPLVESSPNKPNSIRYCHDNSKFMLRYDIKDEDGIITEEHFLDNKLIDDLREIEVEGIRRLVFTELGSVHRLFYSEIEKGNIYNLRVKTSKGNVVAFSVFERLHIEENPNIESVLHIIDKLNRDSVAKYRYMGQSLYSLAYEYYTKRFDKNIVFLIVALRFIIF